MTLDIAPFSVTGKVVSPFVLILFIWKSGWTNEKWGARLFRPILPEDEPLLRQFISRVTKEDFIYRYFSEINEFTHDDLANMTQIDYDREMAIVAVAVWTNGRDPRRDACHFRPDNVDAEFAVLVRSDLEGPWPWWTVARKLIAYTRITDCHG
ncbi:hypothetical protein ACNKHO_16485 [Shigella flexneri]